MDSKDAVAIIALIIPLAIIVAVAYALITGSVDAVVGGIAIVVLAIIIVVIVAYFFVGSYYFLKTKQTVYSGSSMTLDDVQEVDREMEKK